MGDSTVSFTWRPPGCAHLKAEGRIRPQQMGLANLALKHLGKTEDAPSLGRCRQAQPGQVLGSTGRHCGLIFI